MTVLLVGAVSIGLLGVTVLVATFFAPSLTRTPAAARELQCRDNLRRIGLAMQRYHEVHGSFPPAYVADENGKPMHSWRVLLLPYLDEQRLFREYDFSSPWDSPENVRLARRMPAVYACPEDTDAAFGDTSYVVVNGTGVVFDGPNKMPAQEISDGLGNTILVVESVGGGVPWTAPRDLEVGSTSLSINRDDERGMGSNHRAGGAHFLMGDGSVYFFSDRVPTEAIEAMLTASGGESVTPTDYAQR
jgi:hypothetical protein